MLSNCSPGTRIFGGIDFSSGFDPSPSAVLESGAADAPCLTGEWAGSPDDELASRVWLPSADVELIIALLLKLSFELFIDAAGLADKNSFDDKGDNVNDSSGLSGDLSNLLSCRRLAGLAASGPRSRLPPVPTDLLSADLIGLLWSELIGPSVLAIVTGPAATWSVNEVCVDNGGSIDWPTWCQVNSSISISQRLLGGILPLISVRKTERSSLLVLFWLGLRKLVSIRTIKVLTKLILSARETVRQHRYKVCTVN